MKGDLPTGWVRTSVGALYDIVSGGTPSTKISEYWNGDTPWMTSADIHGLKDIRVRKHITAKAIRNSATHLVPRNSLIVVTRVGLGKIALTETPMCFSQDSQALVGNADILFPEYVLYYLSQRVQVFKYRHRGTTIAGVTKKQLSDLQLAFPPLSEQHRIVAKIEELFGKLDAGIEELKKVKAQLKCYRQAVLKYAFEGKLTEEWRKNLKEELEPASVLLEKIKDERERNPVRKGTMRRARTPVDASNLPELPEGWLSIGLEYLASTKKNSIKRGPFGSSIKKEFFVPCGYKVYEQKNVIYNDFERGTYFIDKEKFEELRSFEVKSGDVLMSCSGTVGKIAVVPEGAQSGVINQALLRITLDSGIVDTPYFIHLLRSRIDEIMLESTRGSAMINISSVKDLKRVPFPIPSLPEQHKIVEEIERRLSVADEVERTVEESLKQAGRLRQSILKKAFEGRLVPQDPADEPADKLLERIRAEKGVRINVK